MKTIFIYGGALSKAVQLKVDAYDANSGNFTVMDILDLTDDAIQLGLDAMRNVSSIGEIKDICSVAGTSANLIDDKGTTVLV